jgi:type I restriction enzyme S subunit
VSELPKGWRNPKIKELCSLYNGRAFKQTEWSTSGLPIIRIQNLNKKDAPFNYFNGDFDKRHFIQKGDLLFAWSGTPGTSFGTHEWKGENAVLNQHIFKIEFSNEFISKGFFRHAINHKLEELIGNANGGVGLRHVTKGVFENTKVAFPPLAEQKRIVEKLDQVLAQVDTIKARLDGIPAILKRFRQSVLAAAVSGKLTEEWRRENSLSMSSWLFDCAKNVCEKVQSGSTPRNSPFDQNGTIPFLKVYNIVNQEINFDYKPQFVTQDVHGKALLRSVALPNDVLMNIVGPPLGKVAILTNQYPEWNINQAITLFRVNENNFSYKFLYYILCEGELVRKVMPDTKGSVGQVNISLSQCRDAIMPVPPIEEQTEIVRLVDQYFAFADTIEKQVQKAQQRVDKLTQSILAKAFRGELVPQDPTDEPADELLKRIAAARAEAEALALSSKKTAKKVGKKH